MSSVSILFNPPVKTFLFFALACEAKPFITHFGLKKNTALSVFDIYQTHNMILTITGVGKSAMAAGVAYSLALFKNEPVAVIINLGIAGHKTAALGQLFIAEKITDADNAKQYYPQCLPKTTVASAPLVTVSLPQTDYAPYTLYDMEASAFYETAIRFTSSELILMAKVVSDNAQSAIHHINAKQVSVWFSLHLAGLEILLGQFTARATSLIPVATDDFDQITKVCHFTATEKIQLRKSLNCWQVLSENTALPGSLYKMTSAQKLLSELNTLIQNLPVLL